MKLGLNLLKFEDIREQIIQYLNSNSPYSISNGGQFDFTSSNISYFVDAMAYVCMSMSYNCSNIANNFFLDSTEIRKNAVSRAREIGYTPKRPYAAMFNGKLIYKGIDFDENSNLVIYPRSPFLGSFGNVYYNMKEIVLKYNGNPTQLEGEYVLSQGTFKYSLVYATGESNYSFVISNAKVDENNFSLFVIPQEVADAKKLSGDLSKVNDLLEYKWTLVKNFNEVFDSNVFYMEEDTVNEGFPKIVFGNGEFGNIPSSNDVIVCEYFETKGSEANNENLISLPPTIVEEGTDNKYIYYNTSKLSLQNNFTINNFDTNIFQNVYNKSFGGYNLETIEDIKFNAPKAYSTSGKLVTESDYLFRLSSFPGVGSSYVIGGDTLFPNDYSKLGNVYICLVPSINPIEFLYNNNIYLLSSVETEIRNKISKHSIISTKRHFYKPNYIVLDVTPKIEVARNISVVEQTKIKTQVKSLVVDYFNTKYNKLGVPFRESKISVEVDNLDYVISSAYDLDFSFVVNNNTVSNLVDGVNNILYLPVIDTKDTQGNVTGSTKFIKTNTEIVKDNSFSSEDWDILDLSVDNIEETQLLEYQNKVTVFNRYLKSLEPKKCSIYTKNGLVVNTHHRQIYNKDFKMFNVLTILVDGEKLNYTLGEYITPNNVTVSVKIYEQIVNNATTRTVKFEYVKDGLLISKDVATIQFLNSVVSVSVSEEQSKNLLNYFGVDATQFVYSGYNRTKVPFKLSQVSTHIYTIELELNSYLTFLTVDSNNTIFTITNTGGEEPILSEKNSKMTNWSHNVIDDVYSEVKMDGETVALIEQSHSGIYNFKGYVSDKTIKTLNLNDYVDGDYFIFTEISYLTELDEYVYPKDIVYVFENAIHKATIKRSISADRYDLLNTNFNQGDVFYTGTDYVMYDESITNTIPVNVKNFVENGASNSFSVDASQLLPQKVVDNYMVKTLVDDLYNESGVQINYPFTMKSKIETIYKKTITNTWEELETQKVFHGDLFVYSKDKVGMDDGWYLLENTDGKENRVDISPIETSTLNSLSNQIFDIYKISTTIILSTAEEISMFTNPPRDNVLNLGDYIICVETSSVEYPNGRWSIYDDDYLTYQIDVVNSASTFPIELEKGDVITVKVSDEEIVNFAGQTTETYTDGDLILYIGNNEWKKYDTVNVPLLSEMAQASIGDLIEITTEGNFNNDSRITAPLYDGDMMFGYNDILYYNGTNWIKSTPVNIYSVDSKRQMLNDAGFNSDMYLVQKFNNIYSVGISDKYNGIEIGELDYYSGILKLYTSIDVKYDKNTITKNSETLSNVFNYDNYSTNDIQMDRIYFTPVMESKNFDTKFNQYIIANVHEVTIV